jgi:hypothetical protein
MVKVKKIGPSRGVIALLDVLGAKNMSIEECFRFIDDRFEILMSFEDEKKFYENFRVPQPEVFVFGDTIMIAWEYKKHPERILQPIGERVGRMIKKGLENNILFRGAISLGDYICIEKENTVLGPAVADAASWYEATDWMGVVATPSCGIWIENLGAKLKDGNFTMNTLSEWAHGGGTLFLENLEPTLFPSYVKYEVPVKGRGKQRMWAVSWPVFFFAPGLSLKKGFLKPRSGNPRRDFLGNLEGMSIPVGTENKYQNTIDFFDWFSTQDFADWTFQKEKS